MRKFMMRSAMVFIVVCAIIFSLFYYLTHSTAGTQWLVAKAIQYIPGNIKIGAISGKLSESVRLQNLSYQDNGNTVHINNLMVTWDFMALRKHKIAIDDFKIDEASIRIATPNNSAKPAAEKPSSPFIIPDYRLRLRSVEIKKVILTSDSNNKPLVFNDLRVDAKLSPRAISMLIVTQMTSPEKFNIRLETSGAPNNYDINLGLDQQHINWNLRAHGNLQHLAFQTRENKILGGSLKILGDITFGPNLKWLMEAHVNQINSGLFFPEWPGKMSFNIKASGDNDKLHLDVADVAGHLKQQKLSGSLHIDQLPQQHYIDANLKLGDNTVFAKGYVGAKNDLQWDLQILQLSHYLPDTKGQIQSKGVLTGSRASPTIDASLQGRNLAYLDWSADKLDVDAHYLDDHHPINIHLSGSGITKLKQSFGSLTADLTGTMPKHQLVLYFRNQKDKADLTLQGQMVNHQWHGQLNKLNINTEYLHNWQLQQPAALSYLNNTLQVKAFCLTNPQAKICLAGHWQDDQHYSAELNSQHLPLDWLNPYLGSDIALNGTLNTAIKLAANNQHFPNVDASIQVEPGYFSYTLDEIPERFNYRGGTINAKLTAQTFHTRILLDLLQDSKLNATITADPNKWNSQDYLASPIQGDFNLNAPKLGFLSALIPKIDQTVGRAVAIGKINGTIKQPHLTANVTGYNAGFRLPSQNVRANNMSIKGTVDNFHLEYHTDGKASGGNFHLDGMTELKNGAIITKLKLNGDNMLISNTPGVVVYASPKLNMDIKDYVMHLHGDIFVPRGAFRSYDYDDTVELSEDVVYLQKDASKKPAVENPVQLTSQINLKLGDNITVNSKGLKGNLQGKLTINDIAAGATTAYGRLYITDGHYTFRGQNLVVDNGSLNFNGGPITNPNVNFRAIRKVGGDSSPASEFLSENQARTVGIHITGTLSKYNIDLFSEPALADKTEILAYLLFGQPINNIKDKEGKVDKVANAKVLLSAAKALDIGGGGSLVGKIQSRIQEKFGLTELDLTSFERKDKDNPASTLQHTAVVLGRYLTPKLYINYSYDMLDKNNTLRVRYFLNKNWSVQSESSSDGNGVDLLYSFERG